MRILVAPLEFKGTLKSLDAGEAIARGLHDGFVQSEVTVVPLADGGGGTVDALMPAFPGAQERFSTVHDPLGRPREARWATCESGKTALLEMASASGLTTFSANERNPLAASSAGTGELLRAALDFGCERILLGLGGSGTHDGGIGAAASLGVRFLDAEGKPVEPLARHLSKIHKVDVSKIDPRLSQVSLELLCDVRNPLLGEEGCTTVFAPQKGATPHDVRVLEAGLQHLSSLEVVGAAPVAPFLEGTGAAGGMAFGLARFCHGKLRRGFDVISSALDIFTLIGGADLVVTGEGQLDAQSAFYKGSYSLGRLAHMQRKRVVTFVGAIKGSTQKFRDAFDDIVAVSPLGTSLDEQAQKTATWLHDAARNWALRSTWAR